MRNVPSFWRLPFLIVMFMVCLLQTIFASCDAIDSHYYRRKQCGQLTQLSWSLQPSLLAASQVMDGDVSKVESKQLYNRHQITTATSLTSSMSNSSNWSNPSVGRLENKVAFRGRFGKSKDRDPNGGPSVRTNGQTFDPETSAVNNCISDPDVESKLERALELLNSYSVLTHQIVTENETLAEENIRLQRTANSLAIQRNVAIGGAVLVVVAAFFRYGVFR